MSPGLLWAARLESEDEGQGEVREAGPEVGEGRVRLSRDISDFCPAVSNWAGLNAMGTWGCPRGGIKGWGICVS